MPETPRPTLHEALITGTPEELQKAAEATGRPMQYVVSAPNGAFVTDLDGPGILKQLAKALGQDRRPAPAWDGLSREEKTALLKTGAGSTVFIKTGFAPRPKLCRMAAAMPEMVARIFPRYEHDSKECQLANIEGCDGTGTIQAHLPTADLYACLKCVAEDQGVLYRDIKCWMNSNAKVWDWIHPADRIGYVCPGEEHDGD